MVRSSYEEGYLRRPNLALCTLASFLGEDIEIDYLDEQYAPIDTSKPYDIVAISVMTVNAYHAYELAKEFKESGAHVIIGGVHASMLPSEVARHADSVVVGEGEEVWVTFLEDFKKECPQKIYYGRMINLDDSPTPRYDFLPNEAFYSPFIKKEVFAYQYTRGCPHKCTFCASSKVYGNKYRLKSTDKYIREIATALQRSNNHMHSFADDNIFVNHQQSIELLEEIKKLKIVWSGAADIGIAKNTKLLKLIRESGCYALLLGLETLSYSNLREVDPFKASLLSHYDEYVERIHDHGINICASFIMGFDHDHSDASERIYEFAAKHKIFVCLSAILTPFPATEIYGQFKRENRLLSENFWDKCTGMNVLFEPKNMTQEELLESFYDLITRENHRKPPERKFFVPENF